MKKIYLLAAVTLALTACDNSDDNPNPSSGEVMITATIGESTTSRASDASWTQGDRIGISSTVGNAAGPYINLEYITTEGNGQFTGESLFYYKSMTLTAYYPYSGTKGTTPGTDGKITASTGADNQTADKQPGIDFLWDRQSKIYITNDGKPYVKFDFSHKMSKLTLTFNNSDQAGSVDVSTITSYEIEGLKFNGTFDTSTGVATANGESTTLKMNVSNVTSGNSVAPLILFPQNTGQVKLHIYTDEPESAGILQHYVCELSISSSELSAGKNYQYSITVNKTGLAVNSTIVNWTTPDNWDGNGDAISAD